ncbi:MAG: tetratricopeptide repeat protein [Nitrospirae bacterium]|nr:tetratricopeptide repeat protein [Nitrospirota bacterium]
MERGTAGFEPAGLARRLIHLLVAVSAGWLLLVLAPACERETDRLLDDAFRLWRLGRHVDAVEKFYAYAISFPDSPYAPRALHLAAGGYAAELKDDARAISTYLMLAEKYPASEFAPEAYLRVGDLYRQKTKDVKRAIVYYAAVTEKYPDHALAPEGQFLIGESYLDLGQYDQARVEFKDLVQSYPNSRFAALAQYQYATAFYTEGRCPEALLAYANFLDRHASHSLAPDAAAAVEKCRGRGATPGQSR